MYTVDNNALQNQILPCKITNIMSPLIITESCVYKKLTELKINKSPGPDLLHPRILQELKDSITPFSVLQGSRKPVVGLDTTKYNTFTNSNVFNYSLKNWRKKPS